MMFFHKEAKNEMPIELQIKNALCFLTELACFLSMDFQEQHKKSALPDDLIADDTANDWDWKYIKGFVKILQEHGLISQRATELIEKISNNFSNVSLNASKYEEIIWTAAGLENHTFWQEQRKLAKELLTELEKIQL